MTGDEDLPPADADEQRRKKMWWLVVALAGAVAAGVLLASSVWDNRWNENDVPPNAVVAQKAENLESWCASQTAYDAIRRELFTRAAEVRGSDDQAFAQLADFALLRMNSPVATGMDDRLQSVACSAKAFLDLPPGVRTSGNQTSLSGDLDYVVQPAADGSGQSVRLGNADSIVIPLATLSGLSSQSLQPAIPSAETNDLAPQSGEPARQPPSAPPAPGAGPSFDCGNASSSSENAICSDPGLAALDRQMARQYQSAIAQADEDQRRLLERTRDRFLSLRDRCATSQCIAETYRSRISEIGDIMADRWRG